MNSTQTVINQTKSSGGERWNYIDLIEFLGILFVLIYHTITYDAPPFAEYQVLDYLRYFLRTILSTCVPLFFFANGYLLLNRCFDLKRHIFKSIRMIVLTVIWGMAMVVYRTLLNHEPMAIGSLVKNFWRGVYNNHLWYMGALICIYVFLPLIKLAFDEKRKFFVFFLTIVAVFSFGNTFINLAGSAVLCLIRPGQAIMNFNWFHMFNQFHMTKSFALVYFCLGGLCHLYKDRILAISKMKRNVIALFMILVNCGVLMGLGVIFSIRTGQVWDVTFNGYDTLPTLVNVLAIFVLSLSYQGKERGVVSLVSKNTLGIYLVHMFLVTALFPVVTKLPGANTFIFGVVFAVVILAISLLITVVVKKIPLLRNLMRI